MKRVLMAIGATVGFCGLAAIIIFFVETSTSNNLNLPHGNLAADISANNPVDIDTSVDTSTDAGVVLATSTDFIVQTDSSSIEAVDASTTLATSTDTSTDISEETTTVDSDSSTVVADQTFTDTDTDTSTDANTDQTPATPVPPAPPDDPSSTSTVATATITVTPTLPPPPPLPPPQIIPPPSVSVPIAIPISFNESDFRGDENWQTTWGTMDTTWLGALDLSAGTVSTGAAVYLKNSISWTNYTMNATINWTGGKMFGLMADYRDPGNYVLCDYENAAPGTVTMRLEQYVNGVQFFLSPLTAISWDGDGSNLAVSIKVNGTYGTCSWNGQSVSNSAIGPGRSAMNAPQTGGVGFTVNDPTPNTSGMIVSNVAVTSG